MTQNGSPTILDQIAERNPRLLALIVAEEKTAYHQYISRLILSSSSIAARRDSPWEYKSLLHYGEEEFVKGGTFRVMYSLADEDMRAWHRQAALALGQEVTRSVIYEDEEGLVLFVHDADGYRPARRGDAAYDFIKRLSSDGNLFDIGIDSPPSWANELFVNKQNLDAYACLWYDLDYLSKPGREELKTVRRNAVWRETLRRLGKPPYVDETVPLPEDWHDEAFNPTISTRTGSGAESSLSSKERTNLRNIIGALLAMLKHQGVSEAEVKKFLEDHRYSELPGMSRRNLETVFPLARKSIGEA